LADLQPIIIKKVKKGGGAAHGGAWKVAYADFVTAMMAFFLLLWLLNAVTDEQLEGIANYFAPASIAKTTSGSGGLLAGKTLGEQGVQQSPSSTPSVSMELPPPKAGEGSSDQENNPPANVQEAIRKREEKKFKEVAKNLRQAFEKVPNLKQLAKSLIIDDTPEGLRIQITDQDGLPMFPSGSAKMYLNTKKILELVSKAIKMMPQDIAISGHTDAVKFGNNASYGNWELSSDRANAARRQLIHFGVEKDRISRVAGNAATEPLLPDDPNNARNRRISIVLLRGTGHQTLGKTETGKTQTGAPMSGAAQTGVPMSGEAQTGVPMSGAAQTGVPMSGEAKTGK
jgi:chemotaxis protein MotB